MSNATFAVISAALATSMGLLAGYPFAHLVVTKSQEEFGLRTRAALPTTISFRGVALQVDDQRKIMVLDAASPYDSNERVRLRISYARADIEPDPRGKVRTPVAGDQVLALVSRSSAELSATHIHLVR